VIDAATVPVSTTPVFVEICRLYVMLALLFAAWGKTMGFAAFRRSLADSFPSLARVDAAVAFAIVSAEWAIVFLMLIGGAASRIGIIAALVLLSLFTMVIGATLASGRAIVCNCFGASSHRIGGVDVARNLALTAAAAIAVAGPMGEDAWPPIQQLTLAGIAMILVLASVWLRDLGWLLRAKPQD
jgi:hypothetical protein